MRDLTVTRTVEQWARRRRLQRVVDDGAWALLAAVVIGGGSIAWVAWLPTWSFLFVPASIAVVLCGAWVGWRQRNALRPDAVAAEVDAAADTDGLVRTALAIEGGLATASPEVANVVRAQAVGRLSELEPIGAPHLQIPLLATMLSGVGAVLCSLVVLVAVLWSAWQAASAPELTQGPAFDQARAEELAEALDAIDTLAAEPGLEPLSKRDLKLAAEQLRSALANRSKPREAAQALDEARRTLRELEGRPLASAAALRSARPEDLASGLEQALKRNDPRAARRLGEEVLRRVDGAASDGELRQLGQALAEKVEDPSEAGGAARRAGQALQAGERGDALAALADLMASLGEPVRLEPRREALAAASDAVEEARQDALRRLDGRESEGEGESGSGERRQRSEQTPQSEEGATPKPGEGSTPSPVDVPQGGEGDGGGGTAKGGTEDLRPGGTPGPGGEPEVRVDGERPPGGREEGPPSDGGRLTAGEGPASEGQVSQDAPAGSGEGSADTPGGLPSDEGGAGAASMVAGDGPVGGGFGEGMGSGGTLESPLLELDPDTIAEEWVDLQWDGAGEAMGDVLDTADAGGRSTMAWGEVHARYGSLAEAATRRSRLPLTRRDYVRRYFEAIRPPPDASESP